MKTVRQIGATEIGAMESRNHFKNGASLKSLTSRANFLMKGANIFIVLLALMMTFSACRKDTLNPFGGSKSEAIQSAKKTSTSTYKLNVDYDPAIPYYTNYSMWISSGGSVALYTEFAGGVVWDGRKTGTSTPADGQINEVQRILLGANQPEWGNSPEPAIVSFCAHVGSWSYASTGYTGYEFDERAKNKILSAFSYILDMYGSLDGWVESPKQWSFEVGDATRVLAQMAVWYFIPPDNDQFKVTQIYAKALEYDAVNIAFADVIHAGNIGYAHNPNLTIYYLGTSNYPNDVGSCQPQIVPVVRPGTPPATANVSFTKMKHVKGVELCPEQGEFEFFLWKKGTNGTYTIAINKQKHGAPFVTSGSTPVVSATNLTPGFYVFKEKEYADWKLNISADGLYFEVTTSGQIVWRDFPANWNTKIINIPNKNLGPAYGTVTATNMGNVPLILAGLNPKNGNTVFDGKNPYSSNNTPFVVPNANHFVFAVLDRNALLDGKVYELDFLVGNKYTIVGKGTVRLVGKNLVVEIDGEGSFGCIAFNQLPVTSNGNIHSQKVNDLLKLGATTGFNHDNKVEIPLPDSNPINPGNSHYNGDNIYLYIHCASMQFYQ
jgi:hypothetical protein